MAVNPLRLKRPNDPRMALAVRSALRQNAKQIMVATVDLQTRLALDLTATRKMVRKILRHEGVASARLSLVFVDDRRIRSLNHRYLGHDYPTDVLAFDLSEQPVKKPHARHIALEGEIIISTDTVLRQAKQFGQRPIDELALYICHGVLHLLGYDDHSPADIKKMRIAEARLLRLLICDHDG